LGFEMRVIHAAVFTASALAACESKAD